MTEKRYFWIKLQMDFWKSPVVKMLRKPSGGDTYAVIYLEMILLSLENNGYIYYSGVGDSFAEEIALVLDEETINVEFVLAFLKQKRLIEFSDDTSFKFTEDVTADLVGSESASARRVRAYRKRQKTIANEQKALQCNTNETNRNQQPSIIYDHFLTKTIKLVLKNLYLRNTIQFINQLKKNWMKDLKAYGLYILEKLESKKLVSIMSEQLRMALAMKSSKRALRATTKRFEFKVLKLTLFNMVLLGSVMLGGKMNTTLNHLSETTISGN